MKKIIISILFIYFCLIINTVNAISVPALWEVIWTNWRVVFPDSPVWVFVNTDAYVLNSSANMQINWNFWLQDMSSSSDNTLWWATFDIWTVTWAPKVELINKWNNTFTFYWYARSKASWWIYFSQNLLKNSSNIDIPNSRVIYDRWFNDWKWVLKWCAWSENMWFICFDWITLDTTPPHIFLDTDLSMTTQADYYKIITLNESSTWTIEFWNSPSSYNFTTDSQFKFHHDMRYSWNQSKDYNIKAIDKFWNTASWYIKIVANIPDTNLSSNNIWWAWVQATTYFWTLWLDKIADWSDMHNIDIKLRDTYWNPIVNVPLVKNVDVTLWFANNVDKNQIINWDSWDAINFINSTFNLYSWFWSTEDTKSTSDWNYKVDITSLAPSTQWYLYANTNNDIKVNKLNVIINAPTSWVWEWSYYDLQNTYYSDPYKFTPAVKVDGITNSDDFIITRDNATSFTITWATNKTSSNTLTNIKITHIFDIMSWSTYKNNYMNFQNLSWATSSLNTTCVWFKSWITSYFSSHNDCNLLSPNLSSNIIRNYWNINTPTSSFNDTLNTLPRVIIAWLSKFDIKYSSIINYEINWNDIKYHSYWTNSSIINNQIIISWIVNKNNKNFSVTEDSLINYIWNISKSEAYKLINKNVSIFQKTWTWNKQVLYKKWDYTLSSWPTWIDTIVIDWWDLIISNNITKSKWKVKTVIALKKSDWTKWNIWITSNVKFIWATLISNKSLLSWDWTTYYSDTNSAKDQLFIKWSVISYNSIWWASSSPIICPYYIDKTTCDLEKSKRYDLNHFRVYINWVRWAPINWTLYWINMSVKWYANAPMIIEYDSDIQKNPPSILKK
jgi:hypothetical protein